MHSKNYGAWNFIFDADTVRVIRVFTDPKDTSIDVDKHPLYVVFFKPVGRLLNDHLHDPAKSTLLITSFAGAAPAAAAPSAAEIKPATKRFG